MNELEVKQLMLAVRDAKEALSKVQNAAFDFLHADPACCRVCQFTEPGCSPSWHVCELAERKIEGKALPEWYKLIGGRGI